MQNLKFHFWYTILSLFFAALAVSAYAWLNYNNLLSAWVPLADFLLLTLAIQRLVRLFTYDKITAFIRDWFIGGAPDTLRHTLGELLNCPWCVGLWWSLIVVFLYFLSPVWWYAILVLALSSLASILQIFVNWLGWSAELKKQTAQGPVLPR